MNLTMAPAVSLLPNSMNAIVGMIFVIFLVIQGCLFWAHRRAVVRSRSLFAGLRVRRAHTSESVLRHQRSSSPWLDWCASRMDDGAFSSGFCTREDAMQELDHWLESHTGYLFLQRMGLMAPLIGLLITVCGFLILTLPDGEIVEQVIHALSPLVLGTGVGASLALINNFLLHVAGKQTDLLSSTAASWFDDCSSASRKTVEEKPARELAEALLEMRTTISESVRQYRKAARAMEETSQSLRDTATATNTAAEHLNTDLHAFSDEMKASRQIAAATLRSMSDIGPNLERMTCAWAESAAALKSVIQVPFAQAATQHQQASDVFARSVQQIVESATQLNHGISRFGRSLDEQSQVVQEWSSSLHEELSDAIRRLPETLQKVLQTVPVSDRQTSPTKDSFFFGMFRRRRVDKVAHRGNGRP